MTELVLQLVGVSQQYGHGETSVSALSGIDLEVRGGEMVAVMGASGSGKSTLLSVAGGLATPTSGEVIIEGSHLSDQTPARIAQLRRRSLGFVLQDFNLIPAPIDAHDPQAWWGDALFRPESLEKFRALANLGLTDALRATTDEAAYTFWDFQAGAWRRNAGIRIDHLMLSPQAADRLENVTVHKDVRGWDKPSDHVPVEGEFTF